MSTPPPLPVSIVSAAEEVDQATTILAHAFRTSVFTSYLMRQPDSTWPTDDIPFDLLKPRFDSYVPNNTAAGADLLQVKNWAGVASVWPPGFVPPPRPNVGWQIEEFNKVIGNLKEETLQGQPHYHFHLIGRDPSRPERGIARALVDYYLPKAREKGVPMWIEAITEDGFNVYSKAGFRLVKEVRMGVGKVDSRGELVDDGSGEGLRVWAMWID